MASINKALLVGNVGKEPEIKSFASGDRIAVFSLATSESWKDKAGEKQTHTDWHNVVISGRAADVVEKYVHKGDQVAVDGKIKNRSWDDKEGNKRYSTEIHSMNITLMGSKRDSASVQDEAVKEEPVNTGSGDMDDLPF